MVDIHSHIIPEIDDGANDIKETLEMLKVATKCGIDKIVATPHFCKGFAETSYGEVKELVKDLNNILERESINIKVYHGQEVYYTENIIRDYKEGLIGTINDSDYMLIEFSMRQFDESMFNELYELQLLGVKVIVAHPERYNVIINNPLYINNLINEGFLFQMNAGSLAGNFGKEVKRTCELLLENNIYSFIGSDAHNNGSRSTNINEAKSILKEEYEQYIDIFNNNGNKMLNNEEVKFHGNIIVPKKKKSRFSLFKKR